MWFSKDIIYLKLYLRSAFRLIYNPPSQNSLRAGFQSLWLKGRRVGATLRDGVEPQAHTHHSSIPAFQHSNWGEAPISNLKQAAMGKRFFYIDSGHSGRSWRR